MDKDYVNIRNEQVKFDLVDKGSAYKVEVVDKKRTFLKIPIKQKVSSQGYIH